MNNINESHSKIQEYPINFEKFPLAKKAKFYEIERPISKEAFIALSKEEKRKFLKDFGGSYQAKNAW